MLQTSFLRFMSTLLAITTSSVLSVKTYNSTDIFMLAVTGNVTDTTIQTQAFTDVQNTFLTKCGFPSNANVAKPGQIIKTTRFLAEAAALDTNEVKEKKEVSYLRGQQQNHRQLTTCPDYCANPPPRKVTYCNAACINGIAARRLELVSENAHAHAHARNLKSFPFDPDACLKQMNTALNPYNNKKPGANLVAYLKLAS